MLRLTDNMIYFYCPEKKFWTASNQFYRNWEQHSHCGRLAWQRFCQRRPSDRIIIITRGIHKHIILTSQWYNITRDHRLSIVNCRIALSPWTFVDFNGHRRREWKYRISLLMGTFNLRKVEISVENVRCELLHRLGSKSSLLWQKSVMLSQKTSGEGTRPWGLML